MSTLRLATLGVEIEDDWEPDLCEERHTVVLKFGDFEVARWPVEKPDARWRRGYGDSDEERDAAAEEFVASKLAALFRGDTE